MVENILDIQDKKSKKKLNPKLIKTVKEQAYRFEKAKELRKNPLPEVKIGGDLARAIFDSEYIDR